MKKENIFEVLVEKYRFWIGGILILAILGGSGVLIYRENYAKPSIESRIMNYESRISELEAKINKIQDTSVQTNSNNQVANVQAEQAQPQVAGATSSTTTKSAPKISGKVNINTASAAELDTLPGIGPAYAGRIIDYRDAHGGFKSIDELDNVKGIGKATIDKFRDMVTL